MKIPTFGSNCFPEFLRVQMKYEISPNVISKNSSFLEINIAANVFPNKSYTSLVFSESLP